MDELAKKRAMAAGKIAFGAARIAGDIATATGHGVLGSFLKSHHMTRQAMHLGKMGVEGGWKSPEERR